MTGLTSGRLVKLLTGFVSVKSPLPITYSWYHMDFQAIARAD
jgi:hypothetical protein